MQITKKTKKSIYIILSKAKIISNFKKNVASIFVLFLIFCMVLMPSICINSVYSGLSIWAKCVLPSLLPFMFFTKILTNMNFLQKFTSKFEGITTRLFNAPPISAQIFLMSIISGYPLGAKLTSEYQKLGIITKNEANRICTFCSTSGPLFMIGSVGTAMFLNLKLGYIIFASHILGAILNGIIFRNTFADKNSTIKIKLDSKNFEQKSNMQNLLKQSMSDSIISSIMVGGFIGIAFLIIDLMLKLNIFAPVCNLFNKFGIQNDLVLSVLSGMLEVSKGNLMLSKLGISPVILGTISSFLIGFGGICVFLQAISFLNDAKINKKFYLFQKFVHGLLSATITLALCLLLSL